MRKPEVHQGNRHRTVAGSPKMPRRQLHLHAAPQERRTLGAGTSQPCTKVPSSSFPSGTIWESCH